MPAPPKRAQKVGAARNCQGRLMRCVRRAAAPLQPGQGISAARPYSCRSPARSDGAQASHQTCPQAVGSPLCCRGGLFGFARPRERVLRSEKFSFRPSGISRQKRFWFLALAHRRFLACRVPAVRTFVMSAFDPRRPCEPDLSIPKVVVRSRGRSGQLCAQFGRVHFF